VKVMLRRAKNGHLIAYVAKKDLEEEVIATEEGSGGRILTLANGWQLEFAALNDDVLLPQTLEARRVL